MKREVILFLAVLLILAVGGVASAECNNSEQVIFRLSAEQNAHAAVYDDESYNDYYIVKVCYDRYFALYDQEEGDAAHDCSFGGGNRLFYLSATGNAHASVEGSDTYPIEVCHDGLSGCEVKSNTGQKVCKNLGKEAIVFLSAETNAHLSRRYSSNYPWVVCCEGIGEPVEENDPIACAHYSDDNMYPQYYGMENCTADPFNVSEIDSLCSEGEDSCRCIWTEDQCSLTFNDTTDDGSCFYTCTKTPLDYDSASCNDGYKNVSVNAVINGVTPIGCTPEDPVEGCQSMTALIPCSFTLAEMPFFGAWQFAAAGITIVFVYMIFYRKKR